MPTKTINNLVGVELKQSLKKNILFALKDKKNAALEIYFQFNAKDFIRIESITYFAGYLYYKNISFDMAIISTENIIDIIIANIHIDNFTYISCDKKYGKVECHGHGEYFGNDCYTFFYTRIEDY